MARFVDLSKRIVTLPKSIICLYHEIMARNREFTIYNLKVRSLIPDFSNLLKEYFV